MEKELAMKVWKKQIEGYELFDKASEDLLKFLKEECKDMTLNVKFKNKVEQHLKNTYENKLYVQVNTSNEKSAMRLRVVDRYVRLRVVDRYVDDGEYSCAYIDDDFSNVWIDRQQDKNKLDLELLNETILKKHNYYADCIKHYQTCIDSYDECVKQATLINDQVEDLNKAYPSPLLEHIIREYCLYHLR